MDKNTQLSAMLLPGTRTLIIKQSGDNKFFISSNNSLVIDIMNLAILLKFLVSSGLVSKRVLEGVLSELSE